MLTLGEIVVTIVGTAVAGFVEGISVCVTLLGALDSSLNDGTPWNVVGAALGGKVTVTDGSVSGLGTPLGDKVESTVTLALGVRDGTLLGAELVTKDREIDGDSDVGVDEAKGNDCSWFGVDVGEAADGVLEGTHVDGDVEGKPLEGVIVGSKE